MARSALKQRSVVVIPKVTPPWLLYFLRLAKAAQGDYAYAWKALPQTLPAGVECPTLHECAAVLAVHRLG